MSSTSPSPPLASAAAVPNRHGNPVVAFIIGLSIVLLASILNAAGLNLTKLDHVRTSAIPKAARRRDWMRPLWLLGMILYILSQLIGSTLALEYMRAEYVAPLGSTSLVFNFLFARFLVGTPVTKTDIYGTIVVVLGVIGIVAFGSINSGLAAETDVTHLTALWRRAGWLGYFFAMSFALMLLLLCTSRLDYVLATRGELAAEPFSASRPTARQNGSGLPMPGSALTIGKGRRSILRGVFGCFGCFSVIGRVWGGIVNWITDILEVWAGPKDDKQVAWTLGIGWACCGGGLAGGCLVFAKATVKLLSGSLSHENRGNQFGHVAPIMTIILLVITAVLQIICLNRGLKVYDSTLVVPVFYGVYTATGWLDSLIFNDETNAYKSWTLFLIFVSILVLIGGVVLLTHKKPEPVANKVKSNIPRSRRKNPKRSGENGVVNDDEEGLVHEDSDEHIGSAGENEALYALGDASDDEDLGEDEDIDHHLNPLNHSPSGSRRGTMMPRRNSRAMVSEQTGLVEPEDGDERDRRRRSMDPFVDADGEEMGNFDRAGSRSRR
ncbi:hypothetical protein CPB83DRAFT_852583 [Crepidotus variabilis]|uniref:Uncharacterized protein n=1 Tax=Crepidotus variabilis TaxID=179855 RepID=A0A9P6EIP4_9AGAR|nr:hypothetical protein CPB83DRAFT_852583 [Crepidotus variabilis]